MALDSKQKRGSAVSMSLPFRQWLAEPDGTLANTDRMSMVKFASAVAPAAASSANIPVVIHHLRMQGIS